MRKPTFTEGFWLQQVEGPARRERFCPSQATSDGCVGQGLILDWLLRPRQRLRSQQGTGSQAVNEYGRPRPTAPH